MVHQIANVCSTVSMDDAMPFCLAITGTVVAREIAHD